MLGFCGWFEVWFFRAERGSFSGNRKGTGLVNFERLEVVGVVALGRMLCVHWEVRVVLFFLVGWVGRSGLGLVGCGSMASFASFHSLRVLTRMFGE